MVFLIEIHAGDTDYLNKKRKPPAKTDGKEANQIHAKVHYLTPHQTLISFKSSCLLSTVNFSDMRQPDVRHTQIPVWKLARLANAGSAFPLMDRIIAEIRCKTGRHLNANLGVNRDSFTFSLVGAHGVEALARRLLPARFAALYQA